MKKIAITGGISSGKSSVCQFFKELGAYVVSADALVHELLKSNTDLGQQILRMFGLKKDASGQLDRKALADIVFNDLDRLKELEKILHPAVLQKIEERYDQVSKEGHYSFFVVESPLLFEIGNDRFYDVIVTVLADEEVARRRFAAAGFQPEEYDRRMRRQIKPEQKATLADYTLHNSGSLEELRGQVAHLYKTLQKA